MKIKGFQRTTGISWNLLYMYIWHEIQNNQVHNIYFTVIFHFCNNGNSDSHCSLTFSLWLFLKLETVPHRTIFKDTTRSSVLCLWVSFPLSILETTDVVTLTYGYSVGFLRERGLSLGWHLPVCLSLFRGRQNRKRDRTTERADNDILRRSGEGVGGRP